MSDLVVADRNGRAVSTYRKAPPPKTGPSYGAWAGRDTQYLALPGGGVLQFDLSKLTLADYRSMRDHYQVNVSLCLLMFMMHQLDWHIECENSKIADRIEDNIRVTWTRLMRGVSQAYWAGFSPMALEYDQDPDRGTVVSKFKDLMPEECRVNWKEVLGYAPPNHAKPKFYEYDGIVQRGSSFPIPVENTLWYPLLMENGDYYGRKLLRPAFPSWFFSQLIHLFSNRYFERFGEPVPVGRARYDDDVEMGDGKVMSGRQAMENVLTALRNRSIVVLPSDRDPETKNYDYDIEYLESQMRGADFERYLTRLDEEISLSMFTPLLMLRTADVGSYNLGVTHAQMYLVMLNALAGDLKEYIDRYVLARLRDYNFGPRAPRAEWVPRRLGRDNVETLRAIITEMIRQGFAKVDIDELGTAIGVPVKEVKQLVQPPTDPNANPNNPTKPQPDNRPTRIQPKVSGPRGVGQTRATGRQIAARIRQQVIKAFREGTFGGPDFRPTLGYRSQFRETLKAEGAEDAAAVELTDGWYGRMQRWLDELVQTEGLFSSAEEVVSMIERGIDAEIERLVDADAA